MFNKEQKDEPNSEGLAIGNAVLCEVYIVHFLNLKGHSEIIEKVFKTRSAALYYISVQKDLGRSNLSWCAYDVC